MHMWRMQSFLWPPAIMFVSRWEVYLYTNTFPQFFVWLCILYNSNSLVRHTIRMNRNLRSLGLVIFIYIYLSPKKAAIQLLKERLTHRIRRMTHILRSFGLFHFQILSTREGSYSAINEKTHASPTDSWLVKNSSILFYPTRKFCSSLREKKVVIRWTKQRREDNREEGRGTELEREVKDR